MATPTVGEQLELLTSELKGLKGQVMKLEGLFKSHNIRLSNLEKIVAWLDKATERKV